MKTLARKLVVRSMLVMSVVACAAQATLAGPPTFQKLQPIPKLNPMPLPNLKPLPNLQPMPLPNLKPMPLPNLKPLPMPKPYPLPKPQPKPHPNHQHWGHYPLVISPSPIIVNRVISPAAPLTYVAPDTSNPAPAADIRVVNPLENKVALKFILDDGQVQSLEAGYTAQIQQATVIQFDRGGSAGRARYSLTDGTYKFVVVGGAWELVRQPAEVGASGLVADVAANPVPGQ